MYAVKNTIKRGVSGTKKFNLVVRLQRKG